LTVARRDFHQVAIGEGAAFNGINILPALNVVSPDGVTRTLNETLAAVEPDHFRFLVDPPLIIHRLSHARNDERQRCGDPKNKTM